MNPESQRRKEKRLFENRSKRKKDKLKKIDDGKNRKFK